MLRYLNQGVRSGQTPHPLGLRRGNWEFFAVVEGKMRPVYENRTPGAFHGMRLWLMPPDSPHGWFTYAGEPARIFVFHFASIHPLLKESMSPDRTLSIPLEAADKRMLAGYYRTLLPHYQSPRLSSVVYFESVMLALCTWFLERCREISSVASFDAGSEKLLQAMQWHREHFAEGVSVNDVAAAVNMSPGHLRRQFKKLRGETPKQAFAHATMEEACRMMAQSDLSIKEVATNCGFSGFSEFYRAFKKYTGVSPSQWRENAVYKGKVQPNSDSALAAATPTTSRGISRA